MTKSPDPFAPLSVCAANIRARKHSSVEAVSMYLERIARFNDQLNALSDVFEDEALVAAQRADATLKNGCALGALHGVPITVKDFIDVEGHASTLGMPERQSDSAPADAEVVRRLRAAGAIILGKTNAATRGEDYQTWNALFGRTNNPWDLARTPGGSSGGSAAAVAAGLCAADIGTDIAGSIRQPAALCGLFGHRPSTGIVPGAGDFRNDSRDEPEIDLYTRGPIARSASDLELLLACIAGSGPRDAAWRLELPEPTFFDLAGLRVTFWLDAHLICPVENEILDAADQLKARLEAAGAIVSVSVPPIPPSDMFLNFSALYSATRAALMSQSEFGNLRANAEKGALGPGDLPMALQDYRSWWLAHVERTRHQVAWSEFFQHSDILVAPVVPTTASFHEFNLTPAERTITIAGAEMPYLLQSFWPTFCVPSGLPATSFPVGLSASGMPIGLQAVGARYADRSTIRFAKLASSSFESPPGFTHDDS